MIKKAEIEYKGGWAGHLDVNTYDGSPIIGPHPYHRNINFITGFGGLGPSVQLGACMWVARYILQQHLDEVGKKEVNWTTQCGVDRICNLTPSYERLHLA